MPLPNELLESLPLLSIEGESGCWTADSGPPWPKEWTSEAWVLPLAGLLGVVEGDEPAARSIERLDQAKLPRLPARIHLRDRTIDACILTPCGRARAIKFGYRLGRWAVFRLDQNGFHAVYTGKDSRRL